MRQLMQYRIISGRTVEIRRGLFSIGPTYRKPRGTRRAGTSSLKKIRSNEKSCILNCGRKINCNFGAGDVFLTLKYDDAHYQKDLSFEQAETDIKRFLRKLRKEYGKKTGEKLKAVWVTANWSVHRQAPARLHQHIILPSSALEEARKIWSEIGGTGTVWIRELDDEGDYTKLAAYMVENVRSVKAGKQKWHCCRGMAEPEITEMEPVADLDNIQPDYDGTGLAVVKAVEETTDEDGRVIGKYMRCVWKAPPKIRGGQIVLPNKRRRRRQSCHEQV